MKSSSKSKPVIVASQVKQLVAWYADEDCFLNLAGDYDYLENGYYTSQEYERDAKRIHPTCKEMLDAYVPPLFLEKARLAGLPIPNFYISNGYFEPPVIIDPINPFMIKSRVVLKPGREKSVEKSMTRNFTYAICCQDLPPNSRITYFNSVLGWCASSRYRDVSDAIWRIFRLPLAKVRVIVSETGEVLLSDISQLPFDRLTEREKTRLEQKIVWVE